MSRDWGDSCLPVLTGHKKTSSFDLKTIFIGGEDSVQFYYRFSSHRNIESDFWHEQHSNQAMLCFDLYRFLIVLACLILSVLSTIDQFQALAYTTLFWMVSLDSSVLIFWIRKYDKRKLLVKCQENITTKEECKAVVLEGAGHIVSKYWCANIIWVKNIFKSYLKNITFGLATNPSSVILWFLYNFFNKLKSKLLWKFGYWIQFLI